MVKRIASALALVLLLAAATAPARSANATLNIGVFPTEGAAEVYYAQQLGYFKDAGLDVTLTPIASASAIATAVSSGSLDIGFGSAIPLAAARAHGISFRIILPAVVFANANGSMAVAVAKGSPITKGSDLNGTTIGVNGIKEFSDYAALAWIDKNGGDVKTVKVAEIPFAEMAAALKSGRISAAAMAEPYVSSASADIHILGYPMPAVAPKFSMTVWFASDAWLQKNPDLAKRFQTAVRRAAVWANGHMKESIAYLAAYTKIAPESLAKMERSRYDENLPDAAQIQPVIDVAVRYGGFAPVKADDVIWKAP
jgi:NitT/TauT family transport system substrate-binding protein